MKLLAICRQIKKIDIKNSKATIFADDSVLNEISQSEELFSNLEQYFSKFNLSVNLDKKVKEVSKIDILRDWFGDKLEIK